MGDGISADERMSRSLPAKIASLRGRFSSAHIVAVNYFRSLLQYAMEQTIQVTLPGSSKNTLVTEHGYLGDGKFLCPRSHKSFRLDLDKLSVDNVSSLEPDDREGGSIKLEPWRAAIEDALSTYMGRNFPEGAVSVFAPAGSKNSLIVIYVESSFHRNFRSGRWKSRWTLTIPDRIEGTTCQCCGEIRIQTHIFEEGNVQLLSSKSFKFEAVAKSPEYLGQEVCRKITECDASYQEAIGKSLDEMSDKSFKALRRPLPVFRSKIDWDKIASYQVGSELSRSTSVATPTSSS
ncbi:unnamed protein product [Hydatigera taeniaeformis]|uniref:F-actin-capping protein subunit alpha n=1 Tax=Hydatigena taeniaeformis TaxID=6205 RepID=A0A0R3X6F4_HYDTA|nr:unnamed protein product [Hydatigera taeniaeformis]